MHLASAEGGAEGRGVRLPELARPGKPAKPRITQTQPFSQPRQKTQGFSWSFNRLAMAADRHIEVRNVQTRRLCRSGQRLFTNLFGVRVSIPGYAFVFLKMKILLWSVSSVFTCGTTSKTYEQQWLQCAPGHSVVSPRLQNFITCVVNLNYLFLSHSSVTHLTLKLSIWVLG